MVPCTILVSENDYSEKHPVCYLTKEYHFAFLSSAKIGYNQFIKFLNVALIELCCLCVQYYLPMLLFLLVFDCGFLGDYSKKKNSGVLIISSESGCCFLVL